MAQQLQSPGLQAQLYSNIRMWAKNTAGRNSRSALAAAVAVARLATASRVGVVNRDEDGLNY